MKDVCGEIISFIKIFRKYKYYENIKIKKSYSHWIKYPKTTRKIEDRDLKQKVR